MISAKKARERANEGDRIRRITMRESVGMTLEAHIKPVADNGLTHCTFIHFGAAEQSMAVQILLEAGYTIIVDEPKRLEVSWRDV